MGLSASPTESGFAFPQFAVPITLGAAQTWDVDGGSQGFNSLYVANVTGNQPLDLNLTNGGSLYAATLDTGALALSGSGNLYAIPDIDTRADAVLPAAGISLSDGAAGVGGPALDVQSPGTTSGSIDASAGIDYGNQVSVGIGAVPEATLAVTGNVHLGPGTALDFSIDGNDTTPGVQSSEMTVDGNVGLGDAHFGMSQGFVNYSSSGDCVDLTPGNTYTVLQTSGGGTISGSIYYSTPDAEGGSDFVGPVAVGTTSPTPTTFGQNCTGGPAPEAYINVGSTAITETIAAAPTSTGAPAISGTAQVGQTLTATGNGSWSAYPAPSYTYQWLACASGSCSPISGATNASYTVTSAQQGDTIKLQVTATNVLGDANADSSPLGPVPAVQTTTTTTPTTTPAPPSATQIKSALGGIGHPSGKKAINSLIKSRSYRASFNAPAAGSLRIVWTTVVTTGTGKHKKHKTVTVATGTGQTSGAGTIGVTIRLTAAGKALLQKKPSGLSITATEKFMPTAGSWTTITKKFSA